MSVILYTIADVHFIQGVVTAVLSAVVSGLFLLAATLLNNRHSVRKTEEGTKEVRQAIEQKLDGTD